MTGDDSGHMADVLEPYARPYDPRNPLICFDERPGQGRGDTLVPWPMQPGKSTRYDYADERHGTGGVLLAVAPPTGFRDGPGRSRRTAVDSAPCRQARVR